MTPVAAPDGPYRVPRGGGRWPALALAAAMHAGLFFFLWVGVHWQNTEPVAVEAEVWDLKTQSAAPPAPPETAPPPAPKPVEAAPPAPPPPPKAQVAEPVDNAAEIALERKKKLKAEKDKQLAQELKEQQRQDELDRQLEKQQEKLKAEKLRLAKAEKDKADKEKAKEKALAETRAEKELADKKAAADKLANTKKAAEEQKALAKTREAEMRRITGIAGSGSNGTAEKSTAPRLDSGYVAAITSKIKGNIAYSGSTEVDGNPRAVFKIEQLPTGEIISVRKVKSSGIPAYDSAVENAINKSSPLPKKKDGTVVREVEANFNLKDTP